MHWCKQKFTTKKARLLCKSSKTAITDKANSGGSLDTGHEVLQSTHFTTYHIMAVHGGCDTAVATGITAACKSSTSTYPINYIFIKIQIW